MESNCCGASEWLDETGICSDCMEHADFEEEEDPGDPGDTGRTFENSRRNLMYLDNDSTLFVKQIGLGGKVLSTDGSGNLLWGGKKLLTEE